MKLKIIFWIFVMLFLVSNVYALGVIPAKTKIEFKPDVEQTYKIKVVNDEKVKKTVQLYVDGPLADYVELERKVLSFADGEEIKYVPFKVKLPPDLTGVIESYIIIEESVHLGKGLAGKVRLKHKLIVNAKEKDVYVSFDVERISTEKSELKVNIKSNVEKTLVAKTIFKVSDFSDNLLYSDTKQDVVEPFSFKSLSTLVSTQEVMPGEYTAIASTDYGLGEVELAKRLIIGKPKVKINYVDRYLVSGKINKISLDVESLWNGPLKNVYIQLNIVRKGSVIKTARTESFDLAPLEQRNVIAYVDLTDVPEGSYELDLSIYANKNLVSKYLESVKLFLSEEAASKAEAKNELMYILIGILVGMAIVISFFLGRIVRKKSNI